MTEYREKIIQNYIDGYNEFEVDKMTFNFDDNIIFKNIQNDQVNMTLNGIIAFKQQAEQAKAYFESRRQQITSILHDTDKTEIEIDYFATLAMDFPNGLKKGEKLALKGKSVFVFQDNKIIQLTDIS
ncbi:MAG TPA: nuclear transport factor 2 family protein [Bacteroidia bacterium]|nr:nuclear transport factor 2 family protein [Cyclobacteriaceae bacterium]HRF16011.1 nuclear transport factor 2 family protein [Bacteroidia bacterium]